jgi:hypothetical protein
LVTGESHPAIDQLESQRVERLARRLLPNLRDAGQVLDPVEAIEDVIRWRRAARLAARQLGWHVRTGVSRKAVASAVIEDGPGLPNDLAQRT